MVEIKIKTILQIVKDFNKYKRLNDGFCVKIQGSQKYIYYLDYIKEKEEQKKVFERMLNSLDEEYDDEFEEYWKKELFGEDE